jgi:mannosyltransferase
LKGSNGPGCLVDQDRSDLNANAARPMDLRMAQPLIDGPQPAVAESTDTGPAGEIEWRVAPRTLAVGATLLAAALALFHLGHKSFWLDEGYSIGHASLPWSQFWTVLTEREPNGALHALILFGWIRVGDAEWWLRLPSTVFAVATVPLLYLLLKRLFDERVGALAAVLLALNGFSLQFAQEARAYSSLMVMATASALCFVAYLQDQRRGQWWTWVAVTALLPYTHLFGGLIIGVEVLGALFYRGSHLRPPRRLVTGFAIIGAVSAVMMVLLLTGEDEGQAVGIPGVSIVRYVGVYARVVGNLGVVLLAVVGLLWLSTTVSHLRDLRPLRPFRPTQGQWGFLFLAAWLVLPPVAVALATPIMPLFGARYFVLLVPAASAMTALALRTLPKGTLRTIATAVVVLLTAGGSLAWYLQPPADDVRAAAAVLAPSVEPGDAIVFLPWFMKLPLDPYVERDDVLQADLESTWPAVPWGEFLADHADHPRDTDLTRAIDHDRVWLVVRDDHTAEDARDFAAYRRLLEPDHRLADHIDLEGVDVWLYERG